MTKKRQNDSLNRFRDGHKTNFTLLEAEQPVAIWHKYICQRRGLLHLIRSTQATGASKHDFKPTPELLHGEKTVVSADAATRGIAKAPEMGQSKNDCRRNLYF